MSTEKALQARSESKCELCSATENLGVYQVPPEANDSVDNSVMACATCREQLTNPENIDANHWRCLNDSMWSQVPAVQVVAWRMLNRLSSEGWPQDLLDMLYLDDESLAFSYNKINPKRPLIGCGIILDGQPKLLPMVLEVGGRWNGICP